LRREVPLLLTFLFGTFFVLSNFITADRWKLAAESVNNWVLIVIAFTYILGVGNILRIHGLKISRQETGWGYSLATILGLLVMLLFGIVLWFLPQTKGSQTVRFRVLKEVDVEHAVNASAPMGSGDLFDMRAKTSLVKDQNNDHKASEGDEIETRIAYSYSGAALVPSTVFPITFDRDALAPLGGTGEPLLMAPVPPPGAPGAAVDAAGATPQAIPAGEGPPVPPGVSAAASGLVWNAGSVSPSLFGTARAGNGATSLYTWFYDAVYVPMQSTMFALLAFFISSAAFRAFRIRSTHAVLLGVTALVVILGSVPVGEALWHKFPTLVAWVMNCLQTAGKRAILIGAALGAIATGMKMIVGAEKGYLARD
jgi:hypothetical protein